MLYTFSTDKNFIDELEKISQQKDQFSIHKNVRCLSTSHYKFSLEKC